MDHSGHAIKAQRAYELGLVHRVVPDDQVMDAALELAREIAQHSKPVVALGKCTLNKQVRSIILKFLMSGYQNERMENFRNCSWSLFLFLRGLVFNRKRATSFHPLSLSFRVQLVWNRIIEARPAL